MYQVSFSKTFGVAKKACLTRVYLSLWCGPFVSNLSPSLTIPCQVPDFLVVVMQVFFFIFFNGCLLVNWQVVSNFGNAHNQSWTSFLWTLGLLFQLFMKKPCCHRLNARIFIYSQLLAMRKSSFTHNSSATIKLLYESNNLHDSNITTLLFSTIAP
jgi:hypothetical protein